jgi:hypothetical protein
MKRDPIEAWREYLVEQIHVRYGGPTQEAQEKVAKWLLSMRTHRVGSTDRRGLDRSGLATKSRLFQLASSPSYMFQTLSRFESGTML